MGTSDNFQVTPHQVGDVVAQDIRPLGSRISNYNAMTKGERQSTDRTKASFDYSKQLSPQRKFTDQDLAHGIDWAEFNYNPYGHSKDTDGFTNPNRRRLSDGWAKIVGVDGIPLIDEDVVGGDESTGAGMLQYRNYPSEGFSSFGKKGDKRWIWNGNSWVPGS